MKIRSSREILGIFILVLMTGCDFQETSVDPIVIPNIDTEFSIRMYEKLGQNGRDLYFDLASIVETNCLNGTVSYSLINQDENLDLSIKKIVDPLDCSVGIGHYHSDVSLGALDAGKVYNLTVRLQDVIENHGFLSVDDEKYTINLNTLYGLEIPNTTLYKIPSDLVWGYIAISHLNQREAADAFLAHILTYGTPKLLKEGNYGHFDVLPSGQLVGFETEIIANPLTIIPLSMDFTGNWATLTTEIDGFRNDRPDIEVKLFNSFGKEY